MAEKSYQVQVWLKMSEFIDVLNDCKKKNISVDAWFKEAARYKLDMIDSKSFEEDEVFQDESIFEETPILFNKPLEKLDWPKMGEKF